MTDPKERPTSPDLGTRCPCCNGDGYVLSANERGTMLPRTCDECWGRKRLTSEELARYRMRVGD